VPTIQTTGPHQEAVIQWLEGKGILWHLKSVASGPGPTQWGETLLRRLRTV
jgi:hypothetical protein